jgi:hypothetical protein
VFQHLNINKIRKLFLMIQRHISYIVIGFQISSKMQDQLFAQVIEQIAMVIVGNILKINKAADEVILQSFFCSAFV